MARTPFERFLLALRALDFTEHELYLLFNEIDSRPSSEIIQSILGLRGQYWSDEFQGTEPSVGIEEKEYPYSGSSHVDSKVADEIELALRRDARLTVDEAATLLLRRFPEARAVISRPAAKSSFRRWLLRLLRVVPDTDVLRFVSDYLVREGHRPPSDWSLDR